MTRYDGMSNFEGKGQEVRKQINAMFISKKLVNCSEIPMLTSSRKPFWAPPPSPPGPSTSSTPDTPCVKVSLPLHVEGWLLEV